VLILNSPDLLAIPWLTGPVFSFQAVLPARLMKRGQNRGNEVQLLALCPGSLVVNLSA
jgi:hypothetical protein